MHSSDNQLILRDQWLTLRERLTGRGLLQPENASLSLRWPGSETMWLGRKQDEMPQAFSTADVVVSPDEAAARHAAIYRLRSDVGAIAIGGGVYGAFLGDLGGVMPQLFDEQARYLGRMGEQVRKTSDLTSALRRGGNALLMNGAPVCLGPTATRVAHNAELFEKCATAYVLAVAAGGSPEQLPWLVRWIANGRLGKEQRRAAQNFAAGLLPAESGGY